MRFGKSIRPGSIDCTGSQKENLPVKSQVRGLFQKVIKPVLTNNTQHRKQPPKPHEMPVLHSRSGVNGSSDGSDCGHFKNHCDNQMLFSDKEISSIQIDIEHPFTTLQHTKHKQSKNPKLKPQIMSPTHEPKSQTIYLSPKPICIDESTDSTKDSLQLLKDKQAFVRHKIKHYAAQIDLKTLVQIGSLSEAPSTAYFKAMRSMCLLLKATTQLSFNKHSQVKDAEVFDKWDRIRQYIGSQQGQLQVQELSQIFEHDVARKCCRTSLKQLKLLTFPFASTDIDLESPRVKNMHLKPYFSVAYFLMIYIEICDLIKQKPAKKVKTGGYRKETISTSVKRSASRKSRVLSPLRLEQLNGQSFSPKPKIQSPIDQYLTEEHKQIKIDDLINRVKQSRQRSQEYRHAKSR